MKLVERRLPSNDYYPSLTLDHVDLITEPIREIHDNSIITERLHIDIDILIFATGFHVPISANETQRFLVWTVAL